ncbi:C-C motif chemokine 26-like [Engraulis encrasicolus]|uniref:C-C motif chemokine 26-like n=1 Tax=Engraulis encrasicolus TaxID=184585 RepID=UPI002FCFD3BB
MKTLIALTALVLIVAVNAQNPLKSECCQRYYPNSLPERWVKSYAPVPARCSLDAYVITTVKNARFCVNPKLRWVKMIVAKLTKPKNKPRRQ